MRTSLFTASAYVAPGWEGDEGKPIRTGLTFRTRSTSPSWWGQPPVGTVPVLPTHEMVCQVLQRNELLEDEPLPFARVMLFWRRTHHVVGMEISDASGMVTFRNLMPAYQGYYAVAFDPEGSPIQNAKVFDLLTPVAPP